MTTFVGEKAKMLAGELYLASDPELTSERLRAQNVLFRFNAIRADAEDERRAILTGLFAHFGQGAGPPTISRCDYGSNITICTSRPIVIRVQSSAPRVQIYTASHPIDAAKRQWGPCQVLLRL